MKQWYKLRKISPTSGYFAIWGTQNCVFVLVHPELHSSQIFKTKDRNAGISNVRILNKAWRDRLKAELK